MLNQFYESVKQFNNLAGNNDVSIKGFKNQQRLIYEEMIKETEEAIHKNDVVKLLDGVVDGLYVAFGQLAKLQSLGCDIKGAIKQVCEDNMRKYPQNEEEAQKSILHYNSQNINVNYTYNPEYSRYVIKDSNQKIRKPYNFVATDLTQYVPEELQKKGLDNE